MNNQLHFKIVQAYEFGRFELKFEGKKYLLPEPQTAGTMTQQRTHYRTILQRLKDRKYEIVDGNVLLTSTY